MDNIMFGQNCEYFVYVCLFKWLSVFNENSCVKHRLFTLRQCTTEADIWEGVKKVGQWRPFWNRGSAKREFSNSFLCYCHQPHLVNPFPLYWTLQITWLLGRKNYVWRQKTFPHLSHPNISNVENDHFCHPQQRRAPTEAVRQLLDSQQMCCIHQPPAGWNMGKHPEVWMNCSQGALWTCRLLPQMHTAQNVSDTH